MGSHKLKYLWNLVPNNKTFFDTWCIEAIWLVPKKYRTRYPAQDAALEFMTSLQIRSVHMMPWHAAFKDSSRGFGKEQPSSHGHSFGRCSRTSAALQGVSSHVRLKRLHTLFSTYGVQSSFMVAIERCTELHKRPISTPNPTAWILSDSTCQTHPNTQTKERGIQDHLGMPFWQLSR